ncbi:MAG: Hsp20/alpha crystallin family protein [Proteobacteria bacterium]|nr:Hsp20/alpha crystallin family protein [Pseudomonadota bacterium]MBU1740211.1 Hsp20/alpha crystallin family protein [Pseudomonadota bacterium]
MTMNDKEFQPVDKVEVEGEPTQEGPVFTPPVDIYEAPDKLVLLADLPGVEPAELDVDLKDGILTISGQVPAESETEQVLLEEYRVGRFYRRFSLSEVIDQDKIEASMDNGVLTLVLPKIEPAQPRKIEVSGG